METMRQTWTDDRMDDLAQQVAVGFAQVDARFDRVEDSVATLGKELRGEMQALRAEMNARFGELNGIVAASQRLLLQIAGGLLVGLLTALATFALRAF